MWGAPDEECAGLRERPWAFQGIPRRENRPSRDTLTTPAVPAPGAPPRAPSNGVPGVPPGKMRVQGPPLTLLLAVLQMLQRLCGRVQEEVRALRLCPLEPVQDELLYARDLIKDAKNSRAVRALRSPTRPCRPRARKASHVAPGASADPGIYPPSPAPPGTWSGPIPTLGG